MGWQLERHSFQRTDDLEFLFLQYAFIPALMLGALGALVGGVIWALRASPPALGAWGISIAIISAIIPKVVSPNVHGWTETIVPVWFVLVVLSFTFILLGLARYLVGVVRRMKQTNG